VWVFVAAAATVVVAVAIGCARWNFQAQEDDAMLKPMTNSSTADHARSLAPAGGAACAPPRTPRRGFTALA